jgi:hypothetical protein
VLRLSVQGRMPLVLPLPCNSRLSPGVDSSVALKGAYTGLTPADASGNGMSVSVVRFVAECLDILQSIVTASHQP